MRRKNTLLLCLIAMLLMTALSSIGTSVSLPKMYVEPAEIVDRVGAITEFSVSVMVADVVDLYSYSVRVNFESAVVNIPDFPDWVDWMTVHPEFCWLATSSGFTAEPPIVVAENDLGYIFVSQMLDPEIATNGATGSGLLVTINFEVAGTGVTELDLDPTKLNTVIAGNNIPIDHVAEDGLFDNRGDIYPPHAIFTVSKTYATENEELTFDASASNDEDDGGYIVSYEWDFGDGTTEIYVEGENLTATTIHAFVLGDLASAIYTVTLTVTDNDNQPDTATTDVEIVKWIVGGYFPDLVGWSAKPERPKLYESPDNRGMDLRSLVGNPLEEPYEAYVEFTLYSKDEAKKLGKLITEIVSVPAGKKLEVRAYFDASDPMWRCFSGSPEWVNYGYYHWFWHKYIGFASCYYKNKTTGDFVKGNVEKYFQFIVDPMEHDIGVLSVTTSATEVPQGSTLDISVDVTNVGELEENVDLTIAWIGANATTGLIAKRPITLASGENRTETFTWEVPEDIELGPYLIKASLPILPYETVVGDNSLSARIEVTE